MSKFNVTFCTFKISRDTKKHIVDNLDSRVFFVITFIKLWEHARIGKNSNYEIETLKCVLKNQNLN